MSNGPSCLALSLFLAANRGQLITLDFLPFYRSWGREGPGICHWHQRGRRPREAGRDHPESFSEGGAMLGSTGGWQGMQHSQVHPSGGGPVRCRRDLWWTSSAREPLYCGGLPATRSHQGQFGLALMLPRWSGVLQSHLGKIHGKSFCGERELSVTDWYSAIQYARFPQQLSHPRCVCSLFAILWWETFLYRLA